MKSVSNYPSSIVLRRLSILTFVCLLLGACKDGSNSRQNTNSGNAVDPLSSLTDQTVNTSFQSNIKSSLPQLKQEFELLDMLIDNYFRDEDRYFQEIIFWIDLVFLPTKTDEETVIALNSAPARTPSAYYDMRTQAIRVKRLLEILGYPASADELDRETLKTAKLKEFAEKVSDVLAMDTPFTGSNVIDLEAAIASEAYAEFETRFNDSMNSLLSPADEKSKTTSGE